MSFHQARARGLAHSFIMCFAASVILLAGYPARAQEARSVRLAFLSTTAEPLFEDVLYLALGIELANAGYSSSRRAEDAALLLTASYESGDGAYRVCLELAERRGARKVLASHEFTLALDSSFDSAVAEGLRRLLELSAMKQAGPNEAAPEIGGLFAAGLVSRDGQMRTHKTVRAELGAQAGGAPFLGAFADYARYAAYGSLQAGMLTLRRSWSLSAGARLSLSRAFMAEGVQGGPVYLSTAGLNLQYGLGAAQKIRLAACASGGAAFISLPLADAVLTKTVPYADAGVQAGFPIARDLFLGGDLRLLAAFDRDMTILGLSTALSICKEL